MKKKMFVFLCVIVAIFFGCADLSVDDETAVKAALPDDFDWKVYGEINGDVLMSQIVIDLIQTKRAEDTVANCVNLFSSDITFAEEVYRDYLQCPVEGWDKTKVCTGKYANNGKYNKKIISPKLIAAGEGDDSSSSGDSGDSSSSGDSGDSSSSVDSGSSSSSSESVESSSSSESGNSSSSGDSSSSVEPSSSSESPTLCAIENCWSGGWNELKTILPTKLDVVGDMCKFIPKNSTAPEAKDYLNKFKFNPYLVEEHYHMFGRNDGKPYKYCEAGRFDISKPKTQSLAIRRESKNNYYYDYGKYTFCLDKNDQKIYVVK